MKTLLAALALLALTCTQAKTSEVERREGSSPVAAVIEAGAPLAPSNATQDADWKRAEELEAAGSWELARRAWGEVAKRSLGANEARWVAYRIAETSWRSRASTDDADTTELEAARKALEKLQEPIERPELRDETWARIEESLGDFHWTRRSSQDWGAAWPHYQNALDWWAGSSALEKARARYLGLVFRIFWPRGYEERGWYWSYLPIQVLDSAVAIARTDTDRARAAYLAGVARRTQGGDFAQQRRAFELLEDVVAKARGTDFYDDALFQLAHWYESPGKPDVDEDGEWRTRPDYVQALALYRRYTEEFSRGRAPQWDEARQAIERITATEVQIAVPSAFLPGSAQGATLAWRNTNDVEIALYALDLTQDVRFGENEERGAHQWIERIATDGKQPLRRWTHATRDAGKHEPGNAEIALDPALPAGAYLLEARSGKARARDLVLVGRTLAVVKAAVNRAVVWTCDALSSEPLREARVVLWTRWHDGDRWRWRRAEGVCDAEGLATFDVPRNTRNAEHLALVKSGERTCLAIVGGVWFEPPADAWRLYAVTDRPAYRPGDTISWKLTARVSRDGKLTTPADQSLEYELLDSRGTSVKKGALELNRFGSAWGELTLDASAALGEYHVQFRAKDQVLGGATLFRLEEYKLPEFEVRIATPVVDGVPKLYRLGDRVEAEIVAETYFGAPVAAADVDVTVYQRPYWRRWERERELPWLYADSNDDWRWGSWNKGSLVTSLKLRTDAQGKLRVPFETPAGGVQDLEYTVEARVVDASRREVSASAKVRVTRQAYAVKTEVVHALHVPGDPVEVRFEARDANGRGVAAEGHLKLLRSRWIEIWIDPRGAEVSGSALEAARTADPLVPLEMRAGWRVKKRGYEQEEIAVNVLTTNAAGDATWKIAAPREGYYVVQWRSRDDRRQQVASDASFWVGDEHTQDTGYRAGGVEIVVDRDTLEIGRKSAVMLASSASNRWVLLTFEGERLHAQRVVHLDGTAKLVELDVGEEHAPNFWICAWTTIDGQGFQDTEELVVPPRTNLLTVEVTPDAAEHQPGEEGTLAVTTRDARGEPVSAEVTLAVVDEALLAFQSEYALDPRRFFHGDRRERRVGLGSSLDDRGYRRFVRNERGELKDALADADSESERDESDAKNEERRDQSAFPLGRSAGFAKAAAAGPASPAPTAAAESLAFDDATGGRRGIAATNEIAGGEGAQIQVRSDFRETALWLPDLVTDAQGKATAKLRFPDSLTRWRATARAAGVDAQVGFATNVVKTKKPLTARLAAPRFFVVGDECVLSGLVDNQTGAQASVDVTLEARGLELLSPATQKVTIAAGAQARVDWKCGVRAAGDAELVLSARAGSQTDGMRKSYPVHPHGIDSQVARAVRLPQSANAGAELAFTLDVPAARRKETTLFEVQVSPSLAVTMLDALPYLVDYPYGCTEQTMSRFLPATIVARTLKARGLSAEDALNRVFGGVERESADKTHPRGRKSLDELTAVTKAGLERLYEFQHQDGGWGWWKEGESDAWMSAYVVWGLALARDAGLDVELGRIERGARFLEEALVRHEREPDMQAWMLHAIAAWSKDAREHDLVDRGIHALWERKDALNAYGRALFALACQGFGRTDRAKTLVENLANGVRIDETTDVARIDKGAAQHDAASMKTAHWGSDSISWRWTDSSVEATAFALRALMAVDPKNALVEPTMAWLVQNRRGAQWSSTRDTAIAVLALNEYLSASGELGRDVEYEVSVNGRSLGRSALKASDLLRAPGRFVVDAQDVKDGANEVRVTLVAGKGPLYASARSRFFSLEEPIPSRGSQLFARRDYIALAGRPTLLKGEVPQRLPLLDNGRIASGERVEVVLTLEAKNDLEYLLIEDLKPAGFEAVEQKSGEWMTARELKSGEVAYRFETNTKLAAQPLADDWQRYTQRQRGVHQELRDRKVAFFIDKLPQGVWELRYLLRAEVPGSFHALPVLGEAMYVPEIRCNGAETRVTVDERPRASN